MILAGLWNLGLRAPIPRSIARGGSFGRALGVVGASVRSLGGPMGAFGTGVLTGLLPCGLSWSAFALATQVDRPTAAAGLFLFGLGTGPALLLLGLGWVTLQLRGRTLAIRLAGGVVILFGVLTILRGDSRPDRVELAGDGETSECCDEVLERARELGIDIDGAEPESK